MIDRLLYVATAAALISVLVFDEAFSSNMFRAVGESPAVRSLNMWEVGVIAFLAGLIVAALRWR
jgi:hypothetical protein